MAENSAIEWTDNTFNPWWICDEVSEACDHCYARTLAARFGWAWGADAPRRFFGADHWQEPLRWNERARKAGKPARVFCASMADVFEILPPGHAQHAEMDAARAALWDLIEATPCLTWQLLTKRPKHILRLVPRHWREDGFPPNVWAGCTVETQEWAAKRIPYLLEVPARVRFLSCEPLLGPLDLKYWLPGLCARHDAAYPWCGCPPPPGAGIHQIITGGESGPKARPSHPDWFRHLRDQAQAFSVTFHFKQWGCWVPGDHPAHGTHWDYVGPDKFAMKLTGKKAAGRLLDGRTWDELPEVAA